MKKDHQKHVFEAPKSYFFIKIAKNLRKLGSESASAAPSYLVPRVQYFAASESSYNDAEGIQKVDSASAHQTEQANELTDAQAVRTEAELARVASTGFTGVLSPKGRVVRSATKPLSPQNETDAPEKSPKRSKSPKRNFEQAILEQDRSNNALVSEPDHEPGSSYRREQSSSASKGIWFCSFASISSSVSQNSHNEIGSAKPKESVMGNENFSRQPNFSLIKRNPKGGGFGTASIRL